MACHEMGMVMAIVPTENRATMAAYREGRSIDQFLDDMWQRRFAENPCVTKSTGTWPFRRLESQTATVTQLRAKGRVMP